MGEYGFERFAFFSLILRDLVELLLGDYFVFDQELCNALHRFKARE